MDSKAADMPEAKMEVNDAGESIRTKNEGRLHDKIEIKLKDQFIALK